MRFAVDTGRWLCYLQLGAALLSNGAAALLNATETKQELILANDRLYAAVNKSTGAVHQITLDGQDLLGGFTVRPGPTDQSTGQGQSGVGPYLDCYCTPSGFYTPGSIDPKYRLIKGVDSDNVPYGGVVMNETYPPTGEVLEQYWFLREGETGLHTFSRIAYHNKTTAFLCNLQEFRTLFRPNTDMWTHLSTNEIQHAPNPSPQVLDEALVVQDATWYLGNFTDEPYVKQEADYFTKYTFADVYRDHDVHGLYADGSQTPNNETFGAWLVMNTKDSYYGGPTRNDLVVDGIVYNYIVSNHCGAPTPNITDGFDRTFGPFYYYFNKGKKGASLDALRKDASQYSDPLWNAAFYDSIAPEVKNYVPSGGRGSFKARVDIPHGASRPLAILSENGLDYQDNVRDDDAFQYWADIDPHSGAVEIGRVKAGTYRLTIYADGIFGQYIQDDVEIKAGQETSLQNVKWEPESAGKEIWRIGVPDKSAGEYKHGYARDPDHPNHPQEYRIYWGVYDFPTEFPNGINFEVGKSKEAEDFNYIQWSVFGGKGNHLRPTPYYGTGDVNNWTVTFNLDELQLSHAKTKTATFTVQLAGAKTASGNTDEFNSTQPYANLPYTVSVNSHDLPAWEIPYTGSSSCGARSGVVCHNLAHKFVFDTGLLTKGKNEFVLSLPFNATDYESAILPTSTYIQYDALRLELS